MDKKIKRRTAWNKGIPRSKEVKEKVSKANKGKISWNKGLTKETDERVAKGSKKNRNWKNPEKVFEKISKKAKERLKDKTKHSMYGKKRPDVSKWNKDPEFIKKKLKGLIKKPNKAEGELIAIINQNNLPYKYVGDGQLIVDFKNPDFINTNGEKKIIELFGDYWHNKLNISWHRTEKGTKKVYSKYGFSTLIIWEHELKDESQVINKIINWRV